MQLNIGSDSLGDSYWLVSLAVYNSLVFWQLTFGFGSVAAYLIFGSLVVKYWFWFTISLLFALVHLKLTFGFGSPTAYI